MKLLFVAALSFTSLSVCGQTYNTHINYAKNVQANKGVLIIKKADTVIVKIYPNAKKKTNLHLQPYEEERDSAGLWTTTILIIDKEDPEYINVDVKIIFEKPIENIQWNLGGLAFGLEDKQISNKIAPRLKFRKCECDEGITVVIHSNESVKCSIYGIDEGFRSF